MMLSPFTWFVGKFSKIGLATFDAYVAVYDLMFWNCQITDLPNQNQNPRYEDE